MMDNTPVSPSADLRKFSVQLSKEQIEFITHPGLPGWDLVSPSLNLLADYSSIGADNSVLLLGSHQAAVAASLSRKLTKAHFTISDINSTALEVAFRTVEANHTPSVSFLPDIDLPQDQYQTYQDVLLQLPKGRQLTRRWLVQAYNALATGGNLYIAGPNNGGIQSAIKDAHALFGSSQVLAYKKGNRVAKFIRKSSHAPEPDWAFAPGIAPHTWVEFMITLSNRVIPIHSLPGIFSYDHLDEGTEMLLSVVRIKPGTKVLDVGCGYGIIGLFAALDGAGSVHLTDNNLLAVAAARETLALNHITNSDVFAGDLFDPIVPNTYDLILTNPPFHTAHAVDYHIAHTMISQSFQVLNPGGQINLVANRFIRYDHLVKEIFGNVTALAESGKFHVLSGLKSS